MKKHLFALVILGMVLVSWNVFSPKEAAAAPQWPRTLMVTYCWQIAFDPACPLQPVELDRTGRNEGTASVTIPGLGTTVGSWTFDRRSNTFVMDFPTMNVTYTGEKQGNCYVNGTMTSTDLSGSWEGCFAN